MSAYLIAMSPTCCDVFTFSAAVVSTYARALLYPSSPSSKRNDNAAELAPENRRRVLSMLITRWRRLCCLTMSAAVVAAAPFSLSSGLSFVSGRWDRTVRIWEEGRGHAPEVYHTKRMGPSSHSFLSLLSTLHSSSSSSSLARSAPHSLPSFVFFPVLVVRAPLPPALLLVFRASALPSVSQLSLSFVVDTVSAALFTSDARFILSGFDDGNVRLWKADASARLGVVAAIEYGATLKERWKVDKEVGRVVSLLAPPALLCSRTHTYPHPAVSSSPHHSPSVLPSLSPSCLLLLPPLPSPPFPPLPRHLRPFVLLLTSPLLSASPSPSFLYSPLFSHSPPTTH
ncbi:hypothetical protein C8J57DRAFT_1730224 [Mycena rebaudengoi]|nr:hypothetical protein C8J57DRAFT_1730224 [Mycena rebaudengoi]